MKSTFVFVVCLSCLHVSTRAFEYNFQITHGGGPGGYEGQGRSSVHFKGPQAAEAAPVYKDEQAHASEGYQQGYSVAEREPQGQYAAAAHQYQVGQPDDKYKYAVSNHEEEPQTELRYVSQEEAAKYQSERGQVVKYVPAEEPARYQSERGQEVKYVSAEEARKYQEATGYRSVPAHEAKYQSYPQSIKYSSYKSQAPEAPRYQSSYEPAPQRYEEYSPGAGKYTNPGPAPQAERYVQYQQVPEHQPEHQPQQQHQLHALYQSSEKRYPAASPAAEQKIQYVQAEEQPQQQQYGNRPAPVQYVQQYAHQLKEEPQTSSGASAEYQKPEYTQSPRYIYSYAPGAVQEAPRHHIAQPTPDEQPEQHQQQQQQYHQPGAAHQHQIDREYQPQQLQHQASPHDSERVYAQHYAGGQKFELAPQYKSSPDYGSERIRVSRHTSVSQSASVPQPSFKQSAASADPQLTRIASHGASVYGHLRSHVPSHTETASHSEALSGYAHSAGLEGYPVPQQQPTQYIAQAAAVTSKVGQHSFPHHLTHGIARGVQSPKSPSHLQGYYVEKAKKKSS